MRRSATLVAALFVLALAPTGATPKLPPPDVNLYLHPQRLVDIGGRRLNIICTGTGSPTVILEAGAGDSATAWVLVQPAIALYTRVCSYDRAGVGFSDPAPAPRDAKAVVSDLHALLRAADVLSPYVLVGHSLGGLYVRLYADHYPLDVTGLVLVDPSSEYEDASLPKVEPGYLPWVHGQERQLGECVTEAAQGCAFWPGLEKYQTELRAAGCPHVNPANCAASAIAGEHLARSSYWREWLFEAQGFDKSSSEVRSDQRQYGALPLVVLTDSEQGDLQENASGHDPLPLQQQRAGWLVEKHLHDRIAALSSCGVNIVVAGSSHSIQQDHPAVVVSAVNDVIDDARSKRCLRF